VGSGRGVGAGEEVMEGGRDKEMENDRQATSHARRKTHNAKRKRIGTSSLNELRIGAIIALLE
jgi:hypothetical protein